jgi:hypothetical protein
MKRFWAEQVEQHYQSDEQFLFHPGQQNYPVDSLMRSFTMRDWTVFLGR